MDDRPHGELRARAELRDWTRARAYRDRAAESLELARKATDADVQNRYITIAQHYRTLAEAQERSAEQKGMERRLRAALTECAVVIGGQDGQTRFATVRVQGAEFFPQAR